MLETRTTYKQPNNTPDAFVHRFDKPEPGSPEAIALVRQERKDRKISLLKKVGTRVGASAAAAAIVTGGGVALAEYGKHDPGAQNKNVLVNPNSETRVDSAMGKLGLTPEQHARVNEVARGTALATMQEVKGSGPDGRNGYGQLMFTKADAKNASGEAVWVRAYNTVNGVHINFEQSNFESPDGTLASYTKATLSRSFDFINTSTPVFKDGLLTSEEATKLFNDPSTVLTNGTLEIDGIEKEAVEVSIGADGTVMAGRGTEFTLDAEKEGLAPLPVVQDAKGIQTVLEWTMGK